MLAALAALVRAERRSAIVTAWAGALTGLVFAVLANTTAWAGPATLVYGFALLAAAAVGAEGAKERLAASGFGWRQPVAALVALAAVLAPLAAAVGWMAGGADGPLERRDPTQVPAFVAEESTTRDQARTLVVSGTPARVSYALVRGPAPASATPRSPPRTATTPGSPRSSATSWPAPAPTRPASSAATPSATSSSRAAPRAR